MCVNATQYMCICVHLWTLPVIQRFRVPDLEQFESCLLSQGHCICSCQGKTTVIMLCSARDFFPIYLSRSRSSYKVQINPIFSSLSLSFQCVIARSA